MRSVESTTAVRPSAPGEWVAAAVERCLLLCGSLAPRYARHLQRTHVCRDPLDDALALAARRVVPLPRRVLRPLPGATLPAAARAFNALDRADRRALLALLAGAPEHDATGAPADRQDVADGERAQVAARGEHLASALARLLEGTLAHEARAAGVVRSARVGAAKEPRPPP